MYNYKLFSGNKINLINLLLKIKKLLPKHLNCIPDKTAISLLNLTKKTNKNNYMLETGAGVSTIAMFLGAIAKKKKFFSFEQSQDKISLINQIIHETIADKLKINVSEYWTPIASDSLCKYSGIISLKEFNKKFDFGFFDSSHSLNHLFNEVDLFNQISSNSFFIGLDDGHMKYKYLNLDYINIIRVKAGLKKIKLKDNRCDFFYKELLTKLKKEFKEVTIIEMLNKKKYANDDYFKYYKNLIYKPGENTKEYITCFYKIKK